MHTLIISVVISPLLGSLLAALGGPLYGKRFAHWVAIISVVWSLLASLMIAKNVISAHSVIDFDWYTWANIGAVKIGVGFFIDNLTVVMMLVVNFVSLMVHIYTIGYMADDSGYCRFFAYIALFTFAMLMLVMANNFVQLFFGWELVGLVSYLLIGFWFTRPSATYANLKAFLVNRVGDLGFLLGIGLILAVFGQLDYATVLANSNQLSEATLPALSNDINPATVICLLLFVGAMGKSAQFPLHVWLPDSMEGPTPISALIHAATMVTAGIFMVARLSPLFELSPTALTVILSIGVITAFFMGVLGLVQNDIKRVIAYSTLSQLGYMTAALGASAYSAAIFHLLTHAFFKAVLFLAAGSVIVALHHQQDMRKMGGLRRTLPLTYLTAVIGSLALMGIPPFSGFFSKDMIIASVKQSDLTIAPTAHWALIISAFITALYSVRLLILVFHGSSRNDHSAHTHHPVKEPSWYIVAPLLVLAIPSLVSGGLLADWLLFGDFFDNVGAMANNYEGSAIDLLLHHSLQNPAFIAGIIGIAIAVWLYQRYPQRGAFLAQGWWYRLLLNKYGIDTFNDWFFAGGMRKLGFFCWHYVDVLIVDGTVNQTAQLINRLGQLIRKIQTGRVYHYAFAMLLGITIILLWQFRGQLLP